jgi:hypothetical protein
MWRPCWRNNEFVRDETNVAAIGQIVAQRTKYRSFDYASGNSAASAQEDTSYRSFYKKHSEALMKEPL